MKRFTIAERDGRDEYTLWRKNCESGFGKCQACKLVEGIRGIDFVVILDPHFFAPKPDVIVKVAAKRTVHRHERFNKRQCQVVACDRLKDSFPVRAFQIQVSRRVAAEIHSGEYRKPWSNLLRVKRSPTHDGAHFTLLNQPADNLEGRLVGECRAKIGTKSE